MKPGSVPAVRLLAGCCTAALERKYWKVLRVVTLRAVAMRREPRVVPSLANRYFISMVSEINQKIL
jgi:hypothetical protein